MVLATVGPAPLFFSRARTKAARCFLQCPPRRGGQSFLVATATPLNPFHDPVFLNFPVRLDALALSSEGGQSAKCPQVSAMRRLRHYSDITPALCWGSEFPAIIRKLAHNAVSSNASIKPQVHRTTPDTQVLAFM